MFEVYYPGNCFGNLDVTTKECKKCKINGYCKTKGSVKIDDAGISHFRDLLIERFSCETESNENGLVVSCFEKITHEPKFKVEFFDNGRVLVQEKEIDVQHISSRQNAESIFQKLT